MEPNIFLGRKCEPCEKGGKPLSAIKAALYTKELNEWTLIENKKIEKEFKFKDFREAVAFVNEVADIAEFEQVHIYDVTTGSRVITYAMVGPPNSGVICINGAAAHLVQPGDVVIIAAYGIASPEDLRTLKPRIIHVDEKNRKI